MSILHQIQDSPSNSNALELAIRYAKNSHKDTLLLCGNAVNTLLTNPAVLTQSGVNVLLLKDDIIARGLQEFVGEFEMIDYQGFVDLTLSHEKVVTW